MFISKIPEKKDMNSTTVLILITGNVSLAANQHIGMISEGSCDTEDWGNDAERSAFKNHRNKSLKYIPKQKFFSTLFSTILFGQY